MKKATSVSQSSRSMEENLSRRSTVQESSDSKAPSVNSTKKQCTYNHSRTHSKHQINCCTTMTTSNSISTQFTANEMGHRTPLGVISPNVITSRVTSGAGGCLHNAKSHKKKKMSISSSPCASSVSATPVQQDKVSIPMSFKTPLPEKETVDSNAMPPLLVRRTTNFGTCSQFGAWGIFTDEESSLRDDDEEEERCPAPQEQESEHFFIPIYPINSRSMRGTPPSMPTLDRISPMNEEPVFRLEPRRRSMFSNV